MKAEKNLDPPQLMRVFTYGLVYSAPLPDKTSEQYCKISDPLISGNGNL